jgi:hypothetical protein
MVLAGCKWWDADTCPDSGADPYARSDAVTANASS